MPSFQSAYVGVPPWDSGRPQPERVRLAEEGEIEGAVLYAGCGTRFETQVHEGGARAWLARIHRVPQGPPPR